MSDRSKLHQGHRGRVRERILAEGISNFQPHEVLEFLLFHTVPQKDTNPLAHELINIFGSFDAVLNASADELMERAHVSENTAIFLSSLTDVFSYYDNCDKVKTVYNSTDKMVTLFKSHFIGVPHEKIVFAFLDSGLRLKKIVSYNEGQENGLNFTVKEILRKAVSVDAYNVVMAHNHPASLAVPSKNDAQTTVEIKNQLEHIGVNLLDHLIFGLRNDVFSFAASEKYCSFVSSQ